MMLSYPQGTTIRWEIFEGLNFQNKLFGFVFSELPQ